MFTHLCFLHYSNYLATPNGPPCDNYKVFSSQNRSLTHMYVKLDGLGFLLDAPYVAAPHHGLDAPHHRLDAPFGTRRSSLWLDGLSLGSLAFIVW